MVSRWLAPAAAAACLPAAYPTSADASQLVDRKATDARLAVSADGKALVTYRARGRLRHVLATGAINALAPTPGRQQVSFTMLYGRGMKSRRVFRRFANVCSAYDGPPLAWLVAACKAADGSYWALQSWQRELPNYGVKARGGQAARELRLSHWTGELPVLSITPGWAYRGRFDHLYGSFSYLGAPVYGFRTTKRGAPLDRWGRSLYVDTYNSAYGPGWRRENGFLTRRGTGTFCYGFYNRGGRVGKGQLYRVTVAGPGVTPDVTWQGAAPGAYDPGRERERGLSGLGPGGGNDHRLC